jgi:transposase-like protein
MSDQEVKRTGDTRKKCFTARERLKIFKLTQNPNYTIEEVAKKYNVSRQTVHNITRKYYKEPRKEYIRNREEAKQEIIKTKGESLAIEKLVKKRLTQTYVIENEIKAIPSICKGLSPNVEKYALLYKDVLLHLESIREDVDFFKSLTSLYGCKMSILKMQTDYETNLLTLQSKIDALYKSIIIKEQDHIDCTQERIDLKNLQQELEEEKAKKDIVLSLTESLKSKIEFNITKNKIGLSGMQIQEEILEQKKLLLKIQRDRLLAIENGTYKDTTVTRKDNGKIITVRGASFIDLKQSSNILLDIEKNKDAPNLSFTQINQQQVNIDVNTIDQAIFDNIETTNDNSSS